MMNKKFVQIEVMITVLVLASVISYANAAQVEVINVDPLTKKMLIANLNQGVRFSGSLSISGGANNDINFWITNPHGTVVVNLGRVNNGGLFDFTAQESGAYTLHFDNGFSWFSSKVVTLSFDTSYDIGEVLSSFDPILLIVIGVMIGIIIAGVVGFYYFRRKRTQITPQSPTHSL